MHVRDGKVYQRLKQIYHLTSSMKIKDVVIQVEEVVIQYHIHDPEE